MYQTAQFENMRIFSEGIGNKVKEFFIVYQQL